MSAVAFDTLKFARVLQGKAKFTAEQAEGISEAFADATGEQLATKADLRELGADLRAEMARQGTDLRAEIARQGSELGAEIARRGSELGVEITRQGTDLGADIARQGADLRGEIAAVKAEQVLHRWMLGFNLALTVAVLFLLLRH